MTRKDDTPLASFHHYVLYIFKWEVSNYLGERSLDLTGFYPAAVSEVICVNDATSNSG